MLLQPLRNLIAKLGLHLILISSLILVSLSYSNQVQAQTQIPATTQLQQLLQQLQSLEGHFEQLTIDARGQRLHESQGQMRLAKPSKFYWETLNPYPQIVVSNGRQLWIYDPDLEQVSIQPLDTNLSNTPAIILTGQAQDLAQQFTINLSQDPNTDNTITFTLHPKQADSLFELLQLEFVNDKINALQLTDSLGQKTRIDLHLDNYNQPLPEAVFEFIPPAGVDILQEQP